MSTARAFRLFAFDDYLSRIASEVKEYSLSLPSDADSKGENPAACRGMSPSKTYLAWARVPGLALGFETFHGAKISEMKYVSIRIL